MSSCRIPQLCRQIVLDGVDRTEVEPRPPARFPDRQTARQVLLDGALEMEAQLVVEVFLDAAAPDERAQTEAEILKHRPPSYPAPSTRPTAVVSARHASTSDSSCPRPSGVKA